MPAEEICCRVVLERGSFRHSFAARQLLEATGLCTLLKPDEFNAAAACDVGFFT